MNNINTNKMINGMSVARYIASIILTDSEIINEDYYKLEDILTSKIDIALTNIMLFQNNPEPLIENKLPPKDKPKGEINHGKNDIRKI